MRFTFICWFAGLSLLSLSCGKDTSAPAEEKTTPHFSATRPHSELLGTWRWKSGYSFGAVYAGSLVLLEDRMIISARCAGGTGSVSAPVRYGEEKILVEETVFSPGPCAVHIKKGEKSFKIERNTLYLVGSNGDSNIWIR